ncbi:hypothetical protein H4P35_18515 [Achromobacter sp. 77]|uniref:hypothetical protein n=1 Tax=Achromobacter sp. 77 TaxID=2756133 RepID=UPI001D033C0D|nr:hypothetical protein [Achromobacter sp. 77]UDG74212.1 hypothetical protein H4P35_18515 [Achromobacter sp. 77]
MADAAFELWDTAGNLLCDSRNVNMFLRYMGTASGVFTFNAVRPVVFFVPTGGGFAAMRSLVNNGNGTYTVTFTGVAVEYYIFDWPWVTGGPMDIWAQDGRHIFMSTARPMNVYGNLRIPRYWNSDGTGSGYIDGMEVGGLPARKWAYCPSFQRRGFQCYPVAGGGWSSIWWGENYAARSTGVYSKIQDQVASLFGWAPLRNTRFVSDAEENDIAVIDVTGWQ